MNEFTSPELELKECIIVCIEKIDDVTGTYWALRYSEPEWLKRYPGNAMWYTSLKYDHHLKKGDKIRVWTENYTVIKVEKIMEGTITIPIEIDEARTVKCFCGKDCHPMVMKGGAYEGISYNFCSVEHANEASQAFEKALKNALAEGFKNV